MALDPKLLKKFLDNPAQFSAADMGLNDSEDNALSIPSVDPEADILEQAPEISDPDEIDQSNDLSSDEEDAQIASIQPMKNEMDSDITAKLRKLKAGEPMDDSSEQEIEDLAGDMQAPTDLRKKALQKIKQKYLGQ